MIPHDPADPAVWFRLLLRGIVGLHRHDTAPAAAYLRFVESHRGRAAAEAGKLNIRRLAKSDAFQNAAQQLHRLDNPIPVAAPAPPPPKRRTR